MKIIVRKSDKVVAYAVNDVLRVMDETIVCNTIIIGDLGAVTADVFESDVPADFIGGKYKYIGGAWSENPEYLEPTPPAKDPTELQQEIVQATQQRLDDFARTRSYDGILSACTYATSSVPKFQAEGQYCVVARDETWATLYTILAEVEAGVYPMPTSFADIEPELPALVWP